MWISNTATTAMMFPIGLSIVAHLTRTGTSRSRTSQPLRDGDDAGRPSFGPSIGGMGTPVGTPPNLIGIGMLEKIAGIQVSVFRVDGDRRPDRDRAVFSYLVPQFYCGRSAACRWWPAAPRWSSRS